MELIGQGRTADVFLKDNNRIINEIYFIKYSAQEWAIILNWLMFVVNVVLTCHVPLPIQ